LAVKSISYDMQYAALFVTGLYLWSKPLYEVREIKAFWGLLFLTKLLISNTIRYYLVTVGNTVLYLISVFILVHINTTLHFSNYEF
jgi:hypothetical protein